MENNGYFEAVVNKIEQLELKLLDIAENDQQTAKYGSEAEQAIEETFVKIMNTLAARKEVLLRDVEGKINELSM